MIQYICKQFPLLGKSVDDASRWSIVSGYHRFAAVWWLWDYEKEFLTQYDSKGVLFIFDLGEDYQGPNYLGSINTVTLSAARETLFIVGHACHAGYMTGTKRTLANLNRD
jgi:hypothetical protein